MPCFFSLFVFLFSFSLRVTDCLSSLPFPETPDDSRGLRIDPCQFCGKLATCVELENGQKECKCIEGSESDGGQGCKLIDECARDKPCFADDLGGYCVDMAPPQKYACGCRRGFLPLNVTDPLHGPLICIEIDECLNGDHDCDPDHGICTNIPGSYLCSCANGYEGNGINCLKIPEVKPLEKKQDTVPCSPDPCKNGDCVVDSSKPNGYYCVCWEGYFHPSGLGGICENRNECAINVDDCDKQATCIDTPGSFRCICNDGYSGDGKVCNDIDECGAGTTNPCEGDLICVNRRGTYECVQPTPAPTPQPTPRPTPAPVTPPPC